MRYKWKISALFEICYEFLKNMSFFRQKINLLQFKYKKFHKFYFVKMRFWWFSRSLNTYVSDNIFEIFLNFRVLRQHLCPRPKPRLYLHLVEQPVVYIIYQRCTRPKIYRDSRPRANRDRDFLYSLFYNKIIKKIFY